MMDLRSEYERYGDRAFMVAVLEMAPERADREVDGRAKEAIATLRARGLYGIVTEDDIDLFNAVYDE